MAILLISGQTYYHRAPGIIVLFQTAGFFFHPECVEKKNFVPGIFHLPDPAVQRGSGGSQRQGWYSRAFVREKPAG